MIKGIVQHLRIALLETGYFQTVFELCQQVNKYGFTFPAHYMTGGELEQVSLFDSNEGLAYFRKIGDTVKSEYTGIVTRGCRDDVSDYSYGLRLIGCVPKEKATCDDAFSDDEICQIIMNTIENPMGLRAELMAQSVSVLTTRFSTDSAKIFKDEYPGKPVKDFNYKLAYFSLEISAKVTASSACFAQNCYNGEN